ncbi:HeH/LEM domain-containing protein, partial [Acinetobacter baumannii]|nr:HeH/LEM domain-containing protein [Acinetobacter baumannii]
QTPEDDQKPSDTQPQPINYAGLKVDELRAVLTEKGIAFEAGAKKDELLVIVQVNDTVELGTLDPECIITP